MAGARKTKAASESQNALTVAAQPGVDPTVTLAQVALRPSVKAAIAVKAFAKPAWGELDLTALADELSAQITSTTKGDLQRAEAMLIAQAHTLEALFYELVRRSGNNMGEYLQAAEMYMRLALKAQSQCRATLETLAAIKKPPAAVAFVRQANIAHGPQQVNNAPPAADSRTREAEIAPNELLDVTDGKRLDVGTATQAVGEKANPAGRGSN